MRRRDFTAALLLAAISRRAWAQQPAQQRRIAIVTSGIPADELTETAGPLVIRRFFEALRVHGYSEGRNLVVERYSAEGQPDRYANLAYDVVTRDPDVIVTDHGILLRVLKSTTAKIPIVAITSDPFALSFSENLARYRSNVPIVSLDAGPEIYGKHLQMLKEAVPSAAKVAFLAFPVEGGMVERAFAAAGRRLGVSLVAVQPVDGTAAQLRRALENALQQQPDAAVVSLEGDFLAHRRLIVEWAAKSRLPAMYPLRDYVELGGLMEYGPNLTELGQHLADNVDRILKGTKPGDIPIYQPSKFELVLNQKTAQALGLTFPPALLARADEVIE
jgi:putative tryptophan/tyrosine transport system substrate-binding protein